MLAQVTPEQALTDAASEWNSYAHSRWPETAANS
jgi:putative chitobiose transport system substrate-binding protein